MSTTDWSLIRNFRRCEWIKDPDKVDPRLVFLTDEFATHMKEQYGASATTHVHVAWEEDGHTDGSQHYSGLAVDLHVNGVSVLDQYLLAERFPFTGIGIYPHWNNPGLHLDIRMLDSHCGARWWRDAKGVYRPLDKSWFASMVG